MEKWKHQLSTKLALFAFVLIFLGPNLVCAQNDNSKNFNLGISEGFGAAHFFFLPTVDFRFKRHTLRLAPYLAAQSFAYQIQILRLLQNSDGNLDWMAEAAFNHSNDVWQQQILGDRIWFVPVNRLSIISGIRYDFGKRMTIGLSIGGAIQKVRDTGNLAILNRNQIELKPAFEAGIGVLLFPHTSTIQQ